MYGQTDEWMDRQRLTAAIFIIWDKCLSSSGHPHFCDLPCVSRVSSSPKSYGGRLKEGRKVRVGLVAHGVK